MFFHTIFHIVFFSFLPMWINNVCFISSHHTILVFIIWFLYLESWDDFHANKHNFYCIIFNGYFLKTLQNSLYLMLDTNEFMGFLSYRQNSFYCVWLHCASKILFLYKKMKVCHNSASTSLLAPFFQQRLLTSCFCVTVW